MKIFMPICVVIGLVLGCEPAQDPKMATPSRNPSEPPKSPLSAPKPSDRVKPVDAASVAQGDNPNRIFQLRSLERTVITSPRRKLECWIMDTQSKLQEGMMWLTEKDVRADQGMLFVFADAEPQSFWMQNTLIPLDIIYMDEDGKVLNIAQGKPNDETSLPSVGPAKYVLELKGGMSSKYGIKPGVRLRIPGGIRHKT